MTLRFIKLIFFFFSSRRRHTRLQGDWSSDVCSSDLGLVRRAGARAAPLPRPRLATGRGEPAEDRRRQGERGRGRAAPAHAQDDPPGHPTARAAPVQYGDLLADGAVERGVRLERRHRLVARVPGNPGAAALSLRAAHRRGVVARARAQGGIDAPALAGCRSGAGGRGRVPDRRAGQRQAAWRSTGGGERGRCRDPRDRRQGPQGGRLAAGKDDQEGGGHPQAAGELCRGVGWYFSLYSDAATPRCVEGPRPWCAWGRSGTQPRRRRQGGSSPPSSGGSSPAAAAWLRTGRARPSSPPSCSCSARCRAARARRAAPPPIGWTRSCACTPETTRTPSRAAKTSSRAWTSWERKRTAVPPCGGWRGRSPWRRSSDTRSASDSRADLLGWGRHLGRRLGQTRDAAGRLRLVDHALGGGLGDLADGRRKLLPGLVRIPRGSRLAELPDAGPQRRHHVSIADAVLLRLAVLLLCRTGIRHDGSKQKIKKLLAKGRPQIAPATEAVNAGRQREIWTRATGFPLACPDAFFLYPFCHRWLARCSRLVEPPVDSGTFRIPAPRHFFFLQAEEMISRLD